MQKIRKNFDPNSSIGDGVHEFRRLVSSKLNNVDCTPGNSIYFSNTVTITIGGDAGSSPQLVYPLPLVQVEVM